MLNKTLPRPFEVTINLRPDEYARLRADAEKFGVSKAEALRRRCPSFLPTLLNSVAEFRA